MLLAINYSYPAAKLVKTGKIQIDRFKTPDWNWLIEDASKLRPVGVHFTLEAGNGTLDKVDWDAVETLAEKTSTPFINLHLDARREHYPGLPMDVHDLAEVDRIQKIMLQDVYKAVQQLGAERVIIENSPYRGEAGDPCDRVSNPNGSRKSSSKLDADSSWTSLMLSSQLVT